jgi:threonine aldolase
VGSRNYFGLDENSVRGIAANCTHFLSGHGIRTVRERVQEVADSPLSLLRNDNYGRGGFVTDFENEVAALLGKEAAAFMPSGTMAQPIALRIWSDRVGVKTVAFHPTSHLHMHEQMGYQELHGLNAVLLGEPDRLFVLDELKVVSESISTMLIELPQREIGGQLPGWSELVDICEEARSKGMRLHLDGARLWECAPFYDRSYADIAALFDSVYVSFYKILDGLPAAMLLGPKSFIDEARIWQRRQGGNLYQLSPSAISAKLGLDRHMPRIPEYVAKAKEIADVLRTIKRVTVIPEYPPTNMMHLRFEGHREKLLAASLQIADEERIGLFFYLTDEGQYEVSVGESALVIDSGKLRELIERLFQLADSN